MDWLPCVRKDLLKQVVGWTFTRRLVRREAEILVHGRDHGAEIRHHKNLEAVNALKDVDNVVLPSVTFAHV